MPSQPLHSPTEAAQLIHNPRNNKPLNAYTLRRWCAAHAEYLSDGANPRPGAPRALTARDVEVLRAVADLRSKGMNTDEVNAELTGKSFAVVVDDDDDGDDNADDNLAHFDVQPATRPQDAPLALANVQSALQTRIESIERRLDDQAAATRAAHRDRMLMFAWGVGVGLVAAILLLLAAYLLVQLGTV